MSVCSICLNEVRETRHSTPIRCGHLFHKHCIERWKAQGKHTCPQCRAVFDVSKFKVVVSIQNRFTAQMFSTELDESEIFNVMDIFELSMDVAEDEELARLLTNLGMGFTDADPAIFDTEGTAEE
jgi:hypothetical protein